MPKFYIVGAGPGRADLLTVRAARVLERADAILYDRLVSPEVLELARPAAELIPVGKEEPKAAPVPVIGKRQAILDQAQTGALPTAPDFSKPTHARFRAKLAQIVALAEAGDIAALQAFEINPVSSSPKAMARYRDLCVIAITTRAQVPA